MMFSDMTLDELKKIMEKKLFKELYSNPEDFFHKLHTSTISGIPGTSDDIENRKKSFGMNYISPKEAKSFFLYALEAMDNLIIKFLIISAIVMIVINTIFEEDKSTAWIEGVAILIAVVVVSFVTAFNDHKKERQFRKLQSKLEQEKRTSVIRDGVSQEISTKELVVGDLINLSYGDQIPADCLIIQSNDLQVDESSLTGESDLIKKDNFKTPYIYSGTSVMVGSGQAIVTAVGPNSQSGQIFVLLGMSNNLPNETVSKEKSDSDGTKRKNSTKAVENNEKGHSLLEEKLNKMAINIGRIGIACGFGIFLTLLIRFCIETYTGQHATSFKKEHLVSITHFVVQGITMLVVTIPEGLPLAVAISLSFSVMKMLKCHNLVRQLYSCETMGSATTICTDKTGTLTTNRMTVVQLFINNVLYKKIPQSNELDNQLIDVLCQSIAVNTSTSSRIEEPSLPGALPKQIGNKTECALLGFVNNIGHSYEKLRTQYNDSIIKVFTFNSERKYMATVIKLLDGSFRLFAKGASEIILHKSRYIVLSINETLNVRPLNEVDFKNINYNAIEPMAYEALRTIGLAYRDFDIEPDWNDEQFCISNLIFVCITGIEDPVRPEVPKAIVQCQEAGIVVRMVTGDNIVTARSIAIKCGILKPKDPFLVLEGQEFNRRICEKNCQINQREFDVIWPNLRVLARSSPTDKYNLVSGIISSHLNRNREVVAVTGDGTNDAPALKKADVGFAMGISGTDVAKEASDIIITNDNFASIVKAVLWGRNVYDNISKFIQFQLTVNFSAVVINAVTSLVLKTTALRAVQLLWVNLIMDTLASLALATDEPTLDLLKRKPYGRNKNLISRAMLRFIILHGLYQIVVVLILCFLGPSLFDLENGFDNPHAKNPGAHLTLVFNVYVLMQLFNEVNARKIHGERNVFAGLSSNLIFLSVIVGTLIFQIIIVQFTSKAFWVAPLDLELWMWSICLAFSELLWNQLVVLSMPKWLIPTSLRMGKNGVPSKHIISPDLTDNNARIMWLRGLTRLQTQLRIVNAFRMGVNHTQHTRSCVSPVVLKSLLVPLGDNYLDAKHEKKIDHINLEEQLSYHSNNELTNEINT